MLRRCSLVPLVLLVMFAVSHLQMLVANAADGPPPEGAVLPEIRLAASPSAEEDEYLGVPSKGYFTVPEIKADIVILEIFNMYCPFCQKEAPNVNQLYRAIAARKDSEIKIKMLGVGVGNSPFEVKTFKRVYNIEFPLFPDSDFAIHKLLGEVRTPYFFGIKINSDGKHEVIYSRAGTIGEPEAFLQLILKQSGAK